MIEHRQHSISIIDPFFRRLTDHFGVDLKAILTDLDLPADFFTLGLYHAGSTAIDEICVALEKKCPEENFLEIVLGLFPNIDQNVVFMASKFSENARMAAGYLAEFQMLISGVSIHMIEHYDSIEIVISTEMKSTARAKISFTRLLFFLSIARQATGKNIVPKAVTFAFDPQTEPSIITYLGVEPTWGRVNSLILHMTDAELPYTTVDAGLNQSILPELERRLAILQGRESVAIEVDRVIYNGFGVSMPTLTGVASDLGRGVRKLQRQLRDEGTCFSDILEAARHRRVKDLTAVGSMSKGEIAYDVGFRDTNSLYRSMAKWRIEGECP